MKKKLAAIFCICILGVFLTSYSVKSVMTAAEITASKSNMPVIIIDPGHGGFDGGAVGVDGLIEKNINLAIAGKLYQFFVMNGFETVMTREDDRSLENIGIKGVRERKNSDLHNRKAIADAYDNCILLSIHQNKFSQASSFGAQIFYGPKNEQSAIMGEILQKRMIEMLQPENTRQAKACGDSVYLIYQAKMPALLIECGFLSNADDATKLSDSDYQNKVAFTIFTAIAEAVGWHISEE